MAQKRKNEDTPDISAKRRKGELPVVKIDGITMAIQHPEVIASALRDKGFHPAVPFAINKQTGEAFVQLNAKADQIKLLGLGSIKVNGLELKVKKLPSKSSKLYGLRDSFVWRTESQCFFEAATGLCFDPGQGIYLFWDSANQVYTRVQGDATKSPIGLPASSQLPIQQQYSTAQQAQVWAGQSQHQQMINTPQQHKQKVVNNHQATTQQPKVHQMIKPQCAQTKVSKETEKQFKSIKVKLEIEKNASNFLRKHVNQITKEKVEALKLVKDKDKLITKLSNENQRQKQVVKRLEQTPKVSKAAAQEKGEIQREVERLKDLEKKHAEGKKQLQEALKQMREKEKSKFHEITKERANNAKQAAEKDNQILHLKQLLDQAQKSTEAAAQAKIQMLESEKMKWKSTCDKLSNELTETKNELNKEQIKNSELMIKVRELEIVKEDIMAAGQQVTIPPDLPSPPVGQPVTTETKLVPSLLPLGVRERNKMCAREAELGMQGLRQKLDGTEELFSDVQDRLGKLKNSVKLSSMQIEQNVISVKPKFSTMLEVFKQVSGICSQASQDLLNFNESALNADDSGVMAEFTDLNLKMDEVTSSMRELENGFLTTQPTFGILVAEIEHQKAAIAELKGKLKEAKKTLLEEKSRRETAEDVKDDISELKKLIKKKKRKRRSYSRSRSSSSRSRSPSYRSRR